MLGHVVSQAGIKPDPYKCKAILDFLDTGLSQSHGESKKEMGPLWLFQTATTSELEYVDSRLKPLDNRDLDVVHLVQATLLNVTMGHLLEHDGNRRPYTSRGRQL